MKTIIINEKSTKIPVVDASNGMDIGSSSIPLFFKDTFHFTYLVINTQGDDGCPAQVLAHRTHIVSWNAYAISVEMTDDAFIDSDMQLSPDMYIALIGMQIRSEDGTMLGNVQSVCVDFDSGELLSLTIWQNEELLTFTPKQILSIDDRNIITIRQSDRTHAVVGDSAASQGYSTQSQRISTGEVADIKQTLLGIMSLLESFHEKNMTSESATEFLQNPLADVSKQANAAPFAGTSIPMKDFFAPQQTKPEEMDYISETVDFVTAADLTLNDLEKGAAPVQTLPLADGMSVPVDPAEPCSDTCFTNEQIAQLVSRLAKIESLLDDMSMKLDRGRETISETTHIEQQVQPSLNHETILTSKTPSMSEHGSPAAETTPDVVEKLVLKSQPTASPMTSTVEGERIHLSASHDNIFSGQGSIPKTVNSQKEPLLFTDAQDAYHTPSVQSTPQPVKKAPERKTFTNSKLYWKTSGSQVLGMVLFVAATAALSFFQLL